jgi:peptidyl-prolyl cis-trans isomerase SurA
MSILLRKLTHVIVLLLAALAMPAQTSGPQRTKAEAKVIADSIRAKLARRANFAVLTKQYSEDEITRNKGGKYQAVVKGTIDPEFENFVLGLSLHHISKPFATKYTM